MSDPNNKMSDPNNKKSDPNQKKILLAGQAPHSFHYIFVSSQTGTFVEENGKNNHFK